MGQTESLFIISLRGIISRGITNSRLYIQLCKHSLNEKVPYFSSRWLAKIGLSVIVGNVIVIAVGICEKTHDPSPDR